MMVSVAPGGGVTASLLLLLLVLDVAARISPAAPDARLILPAPGATPNPPDVYLPATIRLSHTQLAFFLRERGGPRDHPLQRSESFVVFQTKELPAVNVSLGSFTQDRALSRELLQPPGPLLVPGRLTLSWKVRAFIVQPRVFASSPLVQVLFYVAGRDWDDFRSRDHLPCVRLHAFRDVREMKAFCRLRGDLALCLAQLQLPSSWFQVTVAPLGRRKSSGGERADAGTLLVELYYTLHEPDGADACGETQLRRGETAPSQPLLRIGSVSLYQPSQELQVVDKHLDRNIILRLPERPLKPKETLSAHLLLAPNATIQQFTIKVKAKKGVTLLGSRSVSKQWKMEWDVQSGAKHSIATVEANKIKGSKGNMDFNTEVLQMDFEMENFTSQSVTRRINWSVEYPGGGPASEAEKVVTELTVVQKDIQAIIPLSMDTEIINTAVLTGRTVALPVKVVSVEINGAVTDVSSFVQCKSLNDDIVKVSMNCDYVFVNGKETRGSMNAGVIFSYEHLSSPLELTVWVPRLPLAVELSDPKLSLIKGWRVPILPERRTARDSEDEEDEEDERRVSRGCALQYQRAKVKVLTQFHTTSTEGSGQMITMLGPEWQVDVTELVQDSLKVVDGRVAELVDRTVLVARDLGASALKVESPLAVDAVLGEAPFSVIDEKVSVQELRAHAISGLALHLQPSPLNSHTLVARATGLQTLSTFKQEACLSVWVFFSDNTAAPLSLYDPKDYNLNASSADTSVVSVSPQLPPPRWPVLVAEGEGSGDVVQVEMAISETCQKSKRKSVIGSSAVFVKVRFGQDEASEEDGESHEGGAPSAHTRAPAAHPGADRAQFESNEQPASVSIDYTNFPTAGGPEEPTDEDYAEEFVHSPRNMSDLEIGMYALLGVFCLAILVFLINCIVFVLKYRHKRIPPEGQANVDHSHHWVFLGTSEPHGALSSQNALDEGLASAQGDQHSNTSSQTSVQSQARSGRGDGSSGGSAKEHGEEGSSSPTSKRKRVKFTTFTLPAEDTPYNSVPVTDPEDIQWVCQDMGFQEAEYVHTSREAV